MPKFRFRVALWTLQTTLFVRPGWINILSAERLTVLVNSFTVRYSAQGTAAKALQFHNGFVPVVLAMIPLQPSGGFIVRRFETAADN